MKVSAGEVYTVYNQYLKRYTACQVAYIAPPDTVSKESWAVVLSGLGRRRPSNRGRTAPSPPALQGLHVLVPRPPPAAGADGGPAPV